MIDKPARQSGTDRGHPIAHHSQERYQSGSSNTSGRSVSIRRESQRYDRHGAAATMMVGRETIGTKINREDHARSKATVKAHVGRSLQPIARQAMKDTDLDFVRDFYRDVPRGLSSRYLSEQAVPQARWQAPDMIYTALRSLTIPITRAENPGRRLRRQADRHQGQSPHPDRGGKSQRQIGDNCEQPAVLSRQRAGDRSEGGTRQHHRRAPGGTRSEGDRSRPLQPCRRRLTPYRKAYNPLAVLTLANRPSSKTPA